MQKSVVVPGKEIINFIAHRDPFLFLKSEEIRLSNFSKVDGMDIASLVEAEVQIDPSHPVFRGHFPNRPIFPGVLHVELMAQLAGFVFYSVLPSEPRRFAESHETLLSSVESARFRKPVLPLDQLQVRVKMLKTRRLFWFFEGTLHSPEGQLITEASFSLALIKKELES